MDARLVCTKVCIHRGASQIGGSCVEIQAQGHRLILDAGMPLDVVNPADARLPDTVALMHEIGAVRFSAMSVSRFLDERNGDAPNLVG